MNSVTTAAHPRRARALRWAARLAVGVVLLVFGIWLILFVTKGRFLKPYFEKIATSRLHRQVRVAGDFNLYFAPFNVAFLADGLTIANVTWAPKSDFLDARHTALTVRTLPLLWGRHEISVADIDGARVTLQWDAAHLHNNWTFDDPNAPPAPFEMPVIARGTITDTHVSYTDPKLQLALKVDIHPLTATNSHIDQAVGFSGTGTLRAKPVSFSGHVDKADQMLHAGSSKLVLHADAADTVIDLSGTMPGISDITAGHYHLAVRGENMANLFDFIGVVVVPTRKYHLVAEVSRDDGTWNFTRIKGVFGDSDLTGVMGLAFPKDRLHLGADLHTQSLDLLDAAPFIGYDPKRLDALGTKGLVTNENGHPRILPDASLRADALRQFDADVRYRVGNISTRNVPVSQIDVTLNLDHGKMTLKPASAILASGKLDGSFALDVRGDTVMTDYDLRLHPTPMGKLLYRFGVEEAGTSGTLSGRLALHGVGNSVRESLAHSNGRMVAIIPRGTMWARNVQLVELDIGTFIQRMFQKKLKDPVEINCGLVGFTVRDGIANADPILIDTRKNVITGRGDFSFRDESVDVGIRAKGKTFSLFSLQSPIGIGGYMAAPHLKLVSPQLLERGGAAVALGVVATPVAALLAFIDPGNGQAAQCGPVLAGATAAAQRTVKGQPRKDLGPAKH
ncbi:AsmA family protein [Novosphingobium sp.]|uniref:AsmA family protein n=1 Tax=Novosphingobium sp. TaxID=1874826 RepID=UPI003D12601F